MTTSAFDLEWKCKEPTTVSARIGDDDIIIEDDVGNEAVVSCKRLLACSISFGLSISEQEAYLEYKRRQLIKALQAVDVKKAAAWGRGPNWMADDHARLKFNRKTGEIEDIE